MATKKKLSRREQEALFTLALVGAIVAYFLWPRSDSPGPGVPAAQAAFVKVITDTARAYEAAPNSLAQIPVRADRARRICALKPAPVDWLGTVERIDTAGPTMSAKESASLKVVIPPDIALETAGNGMFDTEHTLVPIGTPLYDTLFKLRKGDKVRFSGVFFPAATDCLEETSLSEGGMMSDPEFEFRFTAVAPAD